MAIHRLNHAVLHVRDLARSAEFYRGLLGFEVVMEIPGMALFLRAPASTNDHDLGLFAAGAEAGPSAAGRGTVGLYHLAWEVEDLADLREHAVRLSEAGALVGMTDHGSTKSLYARDPDGLELEVVWLIPAALLTAEDLARGGGRPMPLDLDREIARFGEHTRGGVGVSVPGHRLPSEA